MKNLVLIVSVLLVPAIARAQDQPVPQNGTPLVVYLREAGSDRDVRVELLKLDTSSVIVQAAGVRRQLPLTQVSRIEVTVRDSVQNGALIGAIILGGWCAVVCGQGLDRGDQVGPIVAFNAGLGALIGAGLDAMIEDRAVLFPGAVSSRVQLGSTSHKLMFAFRLRF